MGLCQHSPVWLAPGEIYNKQSGSVERATFKHPSGISQIKYTVPTPPGHLVWNGENPGTDSDTHSDSWNARLVRMFREKGI